MSGQIKDARKPKDETCTSVSPGTAPPVNTLDPKSNEQARLNDGLKSTSSNNNSLQFHSVCTLKAVGKQISTSPPGNCASL